jgi:hypothetical protein
MQTNVVFLDTQIFDQANFDFDSDALSTLVKYSKAGRIALHLSEITAEEIRKKIRDRAKAAVRLLEPLRKNRDIGIIRALGRAGQIHADALTLTQRDIERPLFARFEEFLREAAVAVEPIVGGNEQLRAVFRSYFDVRPPFEHRAEKKHEFPDAFAAAEIALWCAQNEKSAYFVSGDKGVGDICAGNPDLHWLPSVDHLADLIVSSKDQWRAEVARRWFHAAEWYIKGQVVARFVALTPISDDPAAEPRIIPPEDDQLRLSNPSVLEVEHNGQHARARVSTHAEIPYQAIMTYDDIGAPFYDDDPLEITTGHARAAQVAYIRVRVTLEFDADTPPREETPTEVTRAVVREVHIHQKELYVDVHANWNP